MSKLHIKKGDTVYVNTGEDRGKTGRVLKVYVDKQRALVEGVNMVSKAVKPTSKNPQGGFQRKEAPVHISNLNVAVTVTVKHNDGKEERKVAPSRIGRKRNAKGSLVRYAKKTMEEIK
ncbi:MAG: 50S ribosomal protein L24 [Candidatus Azobacteroides sp.]|nr:50S ribosomal protein L24 [Candidatus Azobacteroides sp.]